MKDVIGIVGLVFALVDVLMILSTIISLQKEEKEKNKVSNNLNIRMILIAICSIITCVIEIITLFIS